jgi:hypothetical protein
MPDISSAAATHQVEEIDIGFGGFHVFEHQFHRLDFVQVVDKLSQNTRFL